MNYAKMKTTAQKLIGSNGSPCVVEKVGEKIYNPTTHKYEETKIALTGVAVMTSYNEKDINDTTILRGDVLINFVIDEGQADVPKVGDTAIFGDNKYKVVNVKPIVPNGKVTLLYQLQGRQ